MADVLLPPSASIPERAMEQAIVRASDFNPNYVRNWVPHDVPENILPWLAWAYSVDEWTSAWPLEVRREYTEASYFIHRHKGTVAAVRRALRAVAGGDEMILEEWFQYDGPVHTFTVTAEAFDLWLRNGPPLSREFYQQIRKVVYAAKPVRSHWDLRVRVRCKQTLQAAAGSNAAQVARYSDTALAPPIKDGHINLGAAAGANAAQVVVSEQLPVIAKRFAGGLAVAGAITVMAVL